MILAIDTATRWAGLALHDGTAVLSEYGWQCHNTHTIELTPAIRDMLAQAELAPNELEGIAVAIGPGSYTGLRVGLALAKGMAMANGCALIGVPTLDIVAAAIGPMTDQLMITAAAGRRRVCAAVYHWQGKKGWQTKQRPIIASWEQLLAGIDKPTIFTGEISQEAAKQIRTANKEFFLLPPAISVRRAGFLAEIGWQRLRRNQVDDAQTLAPIYLKDAAGKDIAA